MLAQARTVGLLLAVALGAFGCRATVRGSAHAHVSEPSLVLVDSDVWVVEDYDEPVFYTEGFYWRYYGGVWYRSSVHHGNWVRVDVVPVRVRSIDRPTRYVRYRAPATAQKRRGPPPHAPAHGVRGTQPGHDMGGGRHDHAGGHGAHGTPPGHDPAKAEAKEDKAEAKADAKAEKADAKADAKAAKEAEKAAKEKEKADAKAAKEAEKAAAKAAKEQAKADAKAAKEAEKAAKEKAKADAKAAKEAEKAAAKEKAKEDKAKAKEGGSGGEAGKEDKGKGKKQP